VGVEVTEKGGRGAMVPRVGETERVAQVGAATVMGKAVVAEMGSLLTKHTSGWQQSASKSYT
jgi:hypothetical protein